MQIKTITLFASLLFVMMMVACNNEGNTSQQEIHLTGNPTIDKLSQEIAQMPNNPGLYAQRATVFYENEGFDEAIEDMKKAIQLDSTNAGFYHLLADIYLDYFKSKKALETMEHVAAMYPDSIPTLLKLTEYYHILTMYKESLGTIDKILRIDPQNAEAFFMSGVNFKDLGDRNRAINSFQKAVEYDPDLLDAWINLGQLYAEIDPAMARKFFDTAMDIDPDDPLVLHAKADFLRDQDDIKGALALYRRIGAIDQQYEEAFFNAGLMYMELDSVEQAKKMFDITIGVDPVHAKAYFFRGVAFEALGDIDQARKNYVQALTFKPDYQMAIDKLKKLQPAQ
ncbi:MAG: tetratricopeptide repeat protein [Saprospiraceae bacterium]|nr:tetratricopeptide repeat protein [Saprospiraceae bacterium]